ncbi:hypothetical protein [Leeuwenhoekiella marinoflava]|uniref:Uncharacterized protein n=2 Tax=Leeuwenhoekiella marinoflava TaxID=988 RepID=A0A4V1KSK6_9FLAO|nr:hypothetical protein [Leeuwenhoekiella marinoflava]RXG32068.1 hypothetical protein DSL99_1373 [Leeuwenhoekiella marinoflava]SHE96886.1 hypothetical protein SAMN02745246_01428 [Leeuwenhoekiella marinoflava DSM 3653]
MPNQIPYNPDTGYNIPETLENFFSPWKFSNNGSYTLVYVEGSAVPAAYNFDLKIKDFIAADIDLKYDSFLIKFKPRTFTTALDDAIAITGELVSDAEGYALTSENLEVSFAISFAGIGILSATSYRSGFRLEAYGLIDGQEYLLEEIVFNLFANVISQDELVFVPDKASMSYLQNGVDPDDLSIQLYTGSSFVIRANKVLQLSGVNLVANTEYSESITEYTGSGSQAITIALDRTNLNWEGRTLQYYLTTSNTSRSKLFEVLIHQLTTGTIEVDPLNLSFAAVRNIFEAAEQEITINTPSDFTVTVPNWMEYRYGITGILVKPVPSANFALGTYTGEIIIETAVDTARIFVTHRVTETADFNLDGAVIWCRDQEALSTFYSADDDAFASLLLEAVIYNPNTGINQAFLNDYALAFFQNSAEFHIGDVVKRLFSKPDNINRYGLLSKLQNTEDTRLMIYNPPVFCDLTYEVAGTSEIIKNKAFLDGRKPAQEITAAAILKAEKIVQRVTLKSVALVNFYNQNLLSDLVLFRNNQQISSEVITSGSGYLYGQMLRFSEYDPGDRIRLELQSGTEKIKEEFIVFPDQHLSNHIAWYNEYQTQELFEFTGDWRFESEYEMKDFKRLGNLVEELQRVDTRKEMSLVINTGWIPKSNQVIIDEIIMSKLAWLITEDLRTINLVPQSKKMTNEDSANGLYAYDVEFIINKAHDLKSHTSLI